MDELSAFDAVPVGRTVLGESPRWEAQSQRLFWIDVDRGEIWATDLDGGAAPALVFHSDPPLGAMVLHQDGGLVCSVGDTWMRPGEPYLVSLNAAHLRFNDAGVDVRGVIWSATMRRDESAVSPGEGALYRVERSDLHSVLTGLVIGNGIAWSPDDTSMYLVDSGTGSVRRTSFSPDDGPAGDWATWVTVAAGMPDGIAVDVDGGVWVACWGTGEVLRFSSQGRATHRLRLPTPSVTAVCFAGRDLDMIVCTTSAQGVSADVDPLAGRIFVTASPIPGHTLHRAVVD